MSLYENPNSGPVPLPALRQLATTLAGLRGPSIRFGRLRGSHQLARKQVTNNAGMSLKPSAELKRLYARLDPSKETIVYCQSGARASETAGVLQQLGFTDVKVYDSAWLGYGNTLDAPANNATFFNVGLLNSRLSALQDRVNQLEKELAEAKARK